MYGPVALGMVLGKVIAKGTTIFNMTRVTNNLDTARFDDDDADDDDDGKDQ